MVVFALTGSYDPPDRAGEIHQVLQGLNQQLVGVTRKVTGDDEILIYEVREDELIWEAPKATGIITIDGEAFSFAHGYLRAFGDGFDRGFK
jgi:hypothetical protein